ncbi:hypothetical protein [Cesiribacter andamanensis]|uniref:Uncharacterized protein n=1 Tax=Cesiribacter andamanensis AMV16 TaxID=1279009 RepID=M7NS59_9BACT|nr:hypothetical protein [Cesiribacter andamanensis]EMR01289.1 hypothetical protein ADICEAN_03588 [Cesiribacter andamanensis AMV16]
MNKPNRKFSPKQAGGERNERPRRPRSNEGTRAAGFSDKRYSPLLDPDDNKEWKQRDEAGRRYRPAQQDAGTSRPRRSAEGEGYGERSGNRRPGAYRKQDDDFSARPRFRSSDEGDRPYSPRGDARRGDGPRGDGPRGNGLRGDGPRTDSPRRRTGAAGDKPDFERRPRFSKGEDFGDSPRRSSSYGDKPNFRPRSENWGNRRDDDSRGGKRGESRFEGRSEGFRPEGGRTGGPRKEGGYRSEGSRPDGPRRDGSRPEGAKPGGFRGEGRSSNRFEDNPRRGGDSARSEAPRSYGRRDEGSRSEQSPDSRPRTPFKKKN